MPPRRIVYQNWVVELAHDPGDIQIIESAVESDGSRELGQSALEQLRQNVRAAVASLSVRERFFVSRFYFQGLSYRDIAEESGQTAARLAGLHRRALKKLRRSLTPFVKSRFNIETGQNPACPICRSSHRQSIDTLVAGRDKSRSWRPVISELRKKYSLVIRSPQILIGHEKYHW